MNIPARYCTGYLGDIGVPPVDAPMDFSAWFQVYLGGGWRTFDARHNTPRIGRILMAYGRDAGDVAITTSFGVATLTQFVVFTDELSEGADRHDAMRQEWPRVVAWRAGLIQNSLKNGPNSDIFRCCRARPRLWGRSPLNGPDPSR